jgi:hypothetical protein
MVGRPIHDISPVSITVFDRCLTDKWAFGLGCAQVEIGILNPTNGSGRLA